MRWLTLTILIAALLVSACGKDSGSSEKIAVINWEKAVKSHFRQKELQQGQIDYQNLVQYRDQQLTLAKIQMSGLSKLQELKQNSKSNFLEADLQTRFYEEETKERTLLMQQYELITQEVDQELAVEETGLQNEYKLQLFNLRLRLEAVKMRAADKAVVEQALAQTEAELNQKQILLLSKKQQLLNEKMLPLVTAMQERLQQYKLKLQDELMQEMQKTVKMDAADLSKAPDSLTKAIAAIDSRLDKLQENNEKITIAIRQDIESNVAKLAREHKYTVVFHSVKANLKADDITDEVIKGLQNKK